MRCTRKATDSAEHRPGFETLEARVLLDARPFPELSDLLDPANTVVRIETDFGDIDIELFDNSGLSGAAPTLDTVTNFLNYIYDGDYDNTFFHRLAFLDPPTNSMPFVLQGGGFLLDSANAVQEVATDDPIENEFDSAVLLSGTGATVTSTSSTAARVSLPSGTDLSGVSVGMWIRLPGVPGSTSTDENLMATDLFEITAIDDSGDFIDVATDQGGISATAAWAVQPKQNVTRTLAMAKFASDPDSASSQFFVNLADNSDNLDNQNGGFTVFGRIADDESWAVVQMIAGLEIESFTSVHGALGGVPVVDSYESGDPLTQDVVVDMVDIEVIKPFGSSDFYTNIVYFPEGYKADTITETLKLVSLVEDGINYQVIIRYENGSRDQVVAIGSADDQFHVNLPLFDADDDTVTNPLRDAIRSGVPYAFEVHATGGVGASLTHSDFGGTLAEEFTSFDDNVLDTDDAMRWSFSGHQVETGVSADTMPFLLYQNTTENVASLTITFVRANGTTETVTRTLDPHRRGGLEIFSFAAHSDGIVAINIDSDQPLVASLSVYETRTADDTTTAYAVTGTPGVGHVRGVIPGALRGDGPQFLTFYNPNMSNAVLTVDIKRTGTSFSTILNTTIQAGRRAVFDLSSLSTTVFPDNTPVTIRYRTLPSVGVVGEFAATRDGDIYAMAFSRVESDAFAFSNGGFNNSEDVTEILSLYNPNGTSAPLVLTFSFADETQVSDLGMTFMVPANDRLDVSIETLESIFPGLLDMMTDEGSYSLLVESLGARVMASWTRVGAGDVGIAELGLPFMDTQLFGAGIVT